jgi:hypothetical protein
MRQNCGLNDVQGVSLYAQETVADAIGLRLLTTDAQGALDVNSYAPIVSRNVPMANTAVAYVAGHVIGAPSTPSIVNTVARKNGNGVVIETLVARIKGTNATPPDLDIYVLGKETGGSTTLADHSFPVVDLDDWPGIVGVIQIRVASGHWTQLKSGGGVVASVAMVTPFISFALNNTDPADNAMRLFTVSPNAYTFAEADSLSYQLTIRQG